MVDKYEIERILEEAKDILADELAGGDGTNYRWATDTNRRGYFCASKHYSIALYSSDQKLDEITNTSARITLMASYLNTKVIIRDRMGYEEAQETFIELKHYIQDGTRLDIFMKFAIGAIIEAVRSFDEMLKETE